MLRRNFCRPDGRIVKLLLFSKLLDKSPQTFIYFTTFEKKRRVRSPLLHTIKLFGFWYNTYYINYKTNIVDTMKKFEKWFIAGAENNYAASYTPCKEVTSFFTKFMISFLFKFVLHFIKD